MSFNIRIDMTGLLHFAEDDGNASKDFRLGIVLPELEDHVGKMKIVNGPEIMIHRKRVFLKAHRSSSAKGELNFRQRALEGEIKGAVPLELLTGFPTRLDESVVGIAPPLETVRGQIFLEEGIFELGSSTVTWDIPGDLTNAAGKIKFTQSLFAMIRDVDGGVVVVESLDDPYAPPEIHPLAAQQGQDVAIELSYTCSDDPTEGLSAGSRFEDSDFRAHYMLLDASFRREIEGRLLNGREKPVPTRIIEAALAGAGFGRTGTNCLSAWGGTVALNVDRAFVMALERDRENGLAEEKVA